MSFPGRNSVSLPLILALALTACDGRDRRDKEDVSPYSGLWLSQNAFNDFEQFRSDAGQFCAAVRQRPHDHGITQTGGRISLQAYFVDSSGRVYYWHPRLSYRQSVAQRYLIGRVQPAGTFVTEVPTGSDPRSSWQSQAAARHGWVVGSRMWRQENRLTWFAMAPDPQSGSRDLDFVAMTEVEMNRYAKMLRGCYQTHGFMDYGDYGGGQPGGAYGFAPPPPVFGPAAPQGYGPDGGGGYPPGYQPFTQGGGPPQPAVPPADQK